MSLSSFHPAVRHWFETTLGEPSPAQLQGWPLIQSGVHTLIAAPTGTGKTLAAFLCAIDGLLRQGAELRDETQVVYVSPLRALSNDVQKNLQAPLAEMRAIDPTLPEVRVLVRTGDTPASERVSMVKRPPHVLVTTPESLYILLTSTGGRAMLRTARTLIVDEIHALARDKRGAHLALSLERLEALCAGTSDRRRDDVDTDDIDQPSLFEERSRAERFARPHRLQRIGLSATQKPLETVARLLCGAQRDCALVDIGHLRAIDLDIVVPDTPLSAVCSHEQWGELYTKMGVLIRAHRTTLVFANTRKLAERLAARLTDELGAGVVGCHHGSLSKETRLDAEQRLKRGELKALVATASLELGIDIGDVDLVLQAGSVRAIATLLQRVGRAGHGKDRLPKGRMFPLTLDEAVEALALLRSVREGKLDLTPQPRAALDILAQQVIAACVAEDWKEDELFACVTRSFPYRELTRADFDATVALHTSGRHALLHRDAVGGRLMATKRARLAAITSGGAIPDNADYRVLLEPENTFVGTLNEDFAIEANVNDIFQLGNASWRILKIEQGVVRVADAAGLPPTLPFWLGEAPARTNELSQEIGWVREHGLSAETLMRATGAAREVAEQVAEYLEAGRKALGAVPTRERIVLERFFDESGGMQLVVHSLYGSRINRALGLALRKRVCRSFGFELQAAANEEAIVLSLGQQHSFALESVYEWLSSKTARELLIQALLAAPMFTTRWRWNAGRSLLMPRMQGGKLVPPFLQRMRAEDLLAQAFPQAVACGETLPPGDIELPESHPIVRQTVEDCLNEAMDIDGFLELLRGIENGTIERHARDTSEPSVFAHGILSAQPYSFLDDAPLEERRTQAVSTRRGLDAKTADDLGALDAAAIARVREEAWPQPENAEELHEALTWMGFATEREVELGASAHAPEVELGAGAHALDQHAGRVHTALDASWRAWIDELAAQGRVQRIGERWFALEAPKDGKEVLRGRLEALGPVDADDPLVREFAAEILMLESEGVVLRARFPAAQDAAVQVGVQQAGRDGWCTRRLLARVHRYTLERLRREIEAVSAADFLRFLAHWQHATPAARLDGPRGLLVVLRQLAGFQAPAQAWEKHILPARVNGYQKAWLDGLALSGEIAWGRLSGAGNGAARTLPIALFARDDAHTWLALAETADVSTASELSSDARVVHDCLRRRGASFQQELARASGLLPSRLESALSELVGHGLCTCDTFAGLRSLYAIKARMRRRARASPAQAGRWSLFRAPDAAGDTEQLSFATAAHTLDIGQHVDAGAEQQAPVELSPPEFYARTLLARTGVVFKRALLREKLPVAWRDLLRIYRRMEARGEIHGGRFVAGFHGEQFALPQAVRELRAIRKQETREVVTVSAADPLNYSGVLTPGDRIASNTHNLVSVPPESTVSLAS